MIKHLVQSERWERETQLRRPADFRHNLRLPEAMHGEARALEVMAASPALEGLESRLRLGRVLKVRTTS